jgi:hypothetical protein
MAEAPKIETIIIYSDGVLNLASQSSLRTNTRGDFLPLEYASRNYILIPNEG